jgi:hypothetical protein
MARWAANDGRKVTRRLWALPAVALVLGLGFSFRGPLLASSGRSVTVSSSGRPVTIYGCVSETGRRTITDISAEAPPNCHRGSFGIQWPGTEATPGSSPAASPGSSFTSTPAAPTAGGTACVTSSKRGVCGPFRYAGITTSNGTDTRVVSDMWNPINGASQTLTVHNPGDWRVSADTPTGNTAVVSYPDTQQIYTTTSNTPDPLSSFSSITSSFAENGPGSGGGDDYEAAYDIWAGTGSDNYAQEIMIWVDNHGQTPAGSEVATASIDGATYSVWSKANRRHTVSLVLGSDETSGTVNILAALDWLMSTGYVPSGSGLNQIDFGWEICSTGGVAKTFSLTSYGITSP